MVWVVRASGRVEWIGNHTDYNGGFVIPFAIAAYTTARAQLLDRKVIVLESEGFPPAEVSLDILAKEPEEIKAELKGLGIHEWTRYPIGVGEVLWKKGLLKGKGHKISFSTDLPMNAGLSSSASIEAATETAYARMFNFETTRQDAASMCQQAEHGVPNSPCGIMDQAVVFHGGGIFLDCKSLEYKPVSLPDWLRIGVVDTGVKHTIASTGEKVKSAYTNRREQCESAAQYLKVFTLRDVAMDSLKARKSDMDDLLYRRSMHIVGENERTQRMYEILTENSLGQSELYNEIRLLMMDSQLSSTNNFENSCPELDLLTLSCWLNGLAARLSGGGFGGSVVVPVKRGEEHKLHAAASEYKKIAERKKLEVPEPKVYIFEVAKGGPESKWEN